MSLVLKEEITEQQLVDAGFTRGAQYWNFGQSAGCISINRKTREICVKYQSSGYKSIGNQCLPNTLLYLFRMDWISSN
jgi:hypothetical protein